MKRLELIIALIISFAVFVIAGFFISGCGGSSSSTTISYSSSSENRTAAIYLTDGPADEYAHIWMYIHKVLLLPSDDGESIVVFEPEEGPVKKDLLDLRPEDEEDGGELLTIKDVPAGEYDKIRLVVEKVIEGVKQLDSNVTEIDEFKLSSGKIDLNPQGRFYVAPYTMLEITLDIDCDKSVHVSGNHKNFRPVVFVDIHSHGSTPEPPSNRRGSYGHGKGGFRL